MLPLKFSPLRDDDKNLKDQLKSANEHKEENINLKRNLLDLGR